MLPDVAPSAADGSIDAMLRIGRSAAALLTCRAARTDARDQIATSALRTLAGDDRLTIARRPSGRPRLLPPYPELGVSLSRRDGLLLAGYSPDGPVGVDIEIASASLESTRLARDHFSAAEADAVARAALASEPQDQDVFLRLWVAKEAILKATGRGIYDGLDAPDLANCLPRLQHDRAIVEHLGCARVPAAAVTVARTRTAEGSDAYVALAVLKP